jgi:Big-like domain-containing protein
MLALMLLTAAGALASCGGGGGSSGGISGENTATDLVLIDVTVADFNGVALNQTIDFEFSEQLDPDSVRPDTIQIREGPNYGKQVQGYFRVGVEEEGKDTRFVRFYPKLPTMSDLSDAGFQPGTPYRIILPGSPQITTVQNYTGDPLMNETTVNFQTAATGSETLFVDNFIDPVIPGVSPGVSFVNPPDDAEGVSSDDQIVLTFTRRPLNPATVNSTNITLTMESRQGVITNRIVPGTPVLEQSLDRVTVTFEPNFPLADEAVYKLHVDRRVEDLVGFDCAPFDSTFTIRDEPWKSAILDLSFTEQEKINFMDEDYTTASWNEAIEDALVALFTAAGGTGKSGDLTPNANVTITPTNTPGVDLGVIDDLDGTTYDVFNFRKIEVPSGVTVRFLGNTSSTYRGKADPNNHSIKVLSIHSVKIDGTLNISGGVGDGTETYYSTSYLPPRYGGYGGPGAGNGANCNYTTSSNRANGLEGVQPVYGGYGGKGGISGTHTYYVYGAGGGGAGNRTPGTQGTKGGYTYYPTCRGTGGAGGAAVGGNLEREPNVGGSGGGSGANGAYSSSYRTSGAGGGGGGGAIKLQSSASITVSSTGRILAEGGQGGAITGYYAYCAGGGGGGSGGSIKISSTTSVTLDAGATISVAGGAGGPYTATYTYYKGGMGGNGGEGHIRLEAADTETITGVNVANLTYANPSTGEFLPSGGGAPSVGQTVWMNLGVFDPQLEEWKPGNPLHLQAETYVTNDVYYYCQMAIEDIGNPGNPSLEDLDLNDSDGDGEFDDSTNLNSVSEWTELRYLTDLNGYGYSFIRLRIVFQLNDNQSFYDALPICLIFFLTKLTLSF